jgi:hypothetical protein
MNTTRTAFALAAIAAAAALGLAGCSAQPSPEVELAAQNIAQWTLPLDQYTISGAEIQRGDYAAVLLEKPCMEQAGYVYDVPWRDMNALTSESWNPAGRRLFNVPLAQQWGYHSAPTLELTAEAWNDFGESLNGLDPAHQAQLDACIEQGRIALPNILDEANFVAGLAVVAYEDAYRETSVTDAASAWRKCMLPAGISDLPPSPREMPSESLVGAFALSGSSAATPDEIAVAVQDAQCRESTGFSQALYDAEWDHQAAQLRANVEALERLRVALDDHAELTQEIINTHAISR